MANISSRILAFATVATVATIAAVSGAFAKYSETMIAGQKCTPVSVADGLKYGYGYSATNGGNGYGFDCVPANSWSNGSSGGAVAVAGTPTTITTTTTTEAKDGTTTTTTTTTEVIRPSVVIFSDFTKKCEQAVKDLTDSRLVAYYDVLNVVNRTNLNRSITRAEFLKLVLNSAKVDVTKEANPNYSDVDASHTLKNYIAYATRIGMVSGQNGKFRPDDTITRAEAAKIFVNAAGIGLSTNISTFSDVSATNSLATYIQTAYDNCLLNGRKTQGGQTTLADGVRVYEPTSGITLAETAKVLYNIAANK